METDLKTDLRELAIQAATAEALELALELKQLKVNLSWSWRPSATTRRGGSGSGRSSWRNSERPSSTYRRNFALTLLSWVDQGPRRKDRRSMESRLVSLSDVKDAAHQFLHLNEVDGNMIDVTAAAYISNKLNGDPYGFS